MNSDWRAEASCESLPPDDWFSDDRGAIERARAVCDRCPVREPCLEYALESETDYCMYGGCTPTERRAMRDARKGRVPVRVTPKNPSAKWCPGCATELPFHRFRHNTSRPDGLHGECNQCANRRQRAS